MASKRTQRETLAVTIPGLSGRFFELLWPSMAITAESLDINLLIFSVGTMTSSLIHENGLEDICVDITSRLITKERVDGVLLTGTFLSQILPSRRAFFINKLSEIPTIVTGTRAGNFPCILIDNEGGGREAIEHLITVHDHRRIAYVTGPKDYDEAQIRFQAYKYVLSSHNIDYDESLVVAGNFVPSSGARALEELIEKRKARFDAVAFANDDMAVGAMLWAEEHGYRIPEDFAVVGFDNTTDRNDKEPPLSSVDPDLPEQSAMAIKLLLDHVRGVKIPEAYIHPTRFIPRYSCCGSSAPKREPVSLIRETISKARLSERRRGERILFNLMGSSQRFTWSQSQKTRYENISQELPRFGYSRLAVALLSGENFEGSLTKRDLKLEFAFDTKANGPVPIPPEPYPISKILPDSFFPEGERRTTVITTLATTDSAFGILAHEAIPGNGLLYDAVRFELSTVVRNSLLYTEREEAQARLREANELLQVSNEKLKDLDKAKTEFIANVSHELRTPLTMILAPLESIIAGEYGPAIDTGNRLFKSMLQNSNRLLRNLSGFLDYSKIQAGRMALSRTKENISDVLKYYVSSVQSAAQSRKLSLSLNDETSGLSAYIDRDLIEKAVFNLISNAFKFTPEGGSVEIELQTLDESNFSITVRDSGIGIPENKIDMIFDRFTQVDSGLSQKYEGTGIGLSFTKEIVELHGGKIRAKSVINEGSVFTIELPIGQGVKAESLPNNPVVKGYLSSDLYAPPEPIRDDAPHNERFSSVLIVDDNIDMNAYIKSILEKDYRVLSAFSGLGGIAMAKSETPDLIISDIMMPDVDGHEIVRRVKTDPDLKHIPIILLTANADPEARIVGFEHGADEYMTKPFNPRELKARIHSQLEMKTLRDKLAVKNEVLEEVVRLQVKTIENEKDQAIKLQKQAEQQLEDFLLVLASAIESKDHYTGGHVERVARYSRDLARKWGLSEREIHDIYLGAIVHDVGKIGIKDSLLHKVTGLDVSEKDEMRQHTVIGYKLLKKIENIDTATVIAYCHQERWNGSGYPRGLAGEDIPLAARIVAIADYWDSIVTDRPYRSALPMEKAVTAMRAERGVGLDPDLLDIFLDPGEAMYARYIPDGAT